MSNLLLVIALLLASLNAVPASAAGVSADPDLDLFAEETVFDGTPVSPGEQLGQATVRLTVSVNLASGLSMQAANCSGTLIAPDVVLTAGHCVAGYLKVADKATMSVFFNKKTGNGTTTTAKDIVLYPTFKDGPSGDDIALIHLATAIKDRQPMRLATKVEYQDGMGVVIAGYGLKYTNDRASSSDLTNDPEIKKLTAQANLLPKTDPARIPLAKKLLARISQINDSHATLSSASVKAKRIGNDKDDLLETYDFDHIMCEGDSGGPTVIDANGTPLLLGVHSGMTATNNCEKPHTTSIIFGQPADFGIDVFAPNYIGWIQKTVKTWHDQVDL